MHSPAPAFPSRLLQTSLCPKRVATHTCLQALSIKVMSLDPDSR